MTYLVRLTDKRPDAAINAAVGEVIGDALELWKPLRYEESWPKTGFGITNLTARAVAATNQVTGLAGGVAGSAVWGVTAVTVSTWTDWINLAIDDRSYHIVIGVFNRTQNPSITHIRPRANGEDLPQISLEQLYNWDLSEAYFTKPYAVRPGNNHTVRVFTERTIAGVPAERIGLLGYVVAKRAYLIAES